MLMEKNQQKILDLAKLEKNNGCKKTRKTTCRRKLETERF